MNALLNRFLRTLAIGALVAGCTAFATAQPSPKPDDKGSKAEPKTEEQIALDALLAGKWDKAAAEHLEKAVKDKPELGSPELVMARWMFQAQKGKEARQLLEAAAARIPNHPAVYILNAFFAMNEGRTTDAVLSLRQAQIAIDNGTWNAAQRKEFNPDIWNGLATAYEQRNDWANARENLTKLNAEKPGNTQTLQRLARAAFLLNNEGEAEKYLQEAYNADKTLDLPELVMAQLSTQRAVSGEPKDKDPVVAKKAQAEIEKNREKAQEFYNAALKKYDATKALAGTNTDDKEKAAKANRAYAMYLIEQGKKEQAKDHLETARKLDPESRETRTAFGIYDRFTGNLKDAVTNLELALGKSPNYAPALMNLALALMDLSTSSMPVDKSGQERALGYALLYQNQNPRNPDGFAVVGYCQMMKHDVDAADKTLGQAIQTGALSPDAGYFVALFQERKEKYKEAKETLEKVLNQDRGFVYKTQAQDLLKRVTLKAPKETPTSTPAPKP